MKSGAVEPTAPAANNWDPQANTQSNYNYCNTTPESYQSAPAANPPPPYEFSSQPQPQYSSAQPGAPAFFPGGQQSAANPYPTTGYVYGSGTTGYIQAGYVAPGSGNQPAVYTTGGYVVQPTITVISQQYQQVDNYCGYLALGIVVFMCCCPILGFIAAVVAGLAQSKAAFDRGGARRMARISLALSITGIAIAVIIIIVVVSVMCSNYRINGQCFRHRERSGSFDCSFDHFAHNPYYDDGYCYWN